MGFGFGWGLEAWGGGCGLDGQGTDIGLRSVEVVDVVWIDELVQGVLVDGVLLDLLLLLLLLVVGLSGNVQELDFLLLLGLSRELLELLDLWAGGSRRRGQRLLLLLLML